MPFRHRGGRCRGVILQTPSGAVFASLIVNPGDAIIVIPTGRQTPLDGDDDGPQPPLSHRTDVDGASRSASKEPAGSRWSHGSAAFRYGGNRWRS
jgi:hypothetical protein